MKLVAVIGLLLAFALQVVTWPELTLRLAPAFLLAFAAAWGFATTMQQGFWLAVGSGLLLDLYAGVSFGRFTTASLLAGAVLLLYAETRPGELAGPAKISLFTVAAVAYELAVLTITAVSYRPFPFFAELVSVATLNLLGSVAVFAICSPLLARLIYRPHAPRSLQY